MSFQVVTGTPNHMAVVATKASWGDARKWALEHLDYMRLDCRKYDGAAVAMVDAAIATIKASPQPTGTEFVEVSFPYLGVTFCLQLKRVP
jgi:hypothetical protein